MNYGKIQSINYGVLAILLSIISVNTLAKEKKGNHSTEIEYKCHVELLGGLQTIHFISSKEKSARKIEGLLVGKKIMTGLSKNKMKVYNVTECTNLYSKFIDKRSNILDEDIAR